MLSVLFIAGIAGGIYFMSRPQADNTNAEKRLLSSAAYVSSASYELEDQTFLTIQGARAVDTPMTFTIEAFNKQVKYRIHFGDGASAEAKTPTVRHVYRKPGAYRLKLVVSHQGSEKVLHVETLYIDQQTEVAWDF